MPALVTGGTGFIGRRLLRSLPSARVTSRDPEAVSRSLGSAVDLRAWLPSEPLPPSILEGVDVVYHLVGENLARRWTRHRKQAIYDSRIESTKRLVEAMGRTETPPSVLVCSSAIGFYGDRGDELLDETSTMGSGFLAELCADWEAEAARAADHGVRVVSVRAGIVLDASGGPLAKMLLPFKLGLGGRLGSGRQFISWIHLDDMVGVLLRVARDDAVRGPVNAVSPGSVTNAVFTAELARALRRPAILPVPAFGLKLLFGEMASVLLESQRVVPAQMVERGFSFAHPELTDALAAALGPSRPRHAED